MYKFGSVSRHQNCFERILQSIHVFNMSKRVRHPPGCYALLFDNSRDLDYGSNSQSNSKPCSMGVYKVGRVVARRIQRGEVLSKRKHMGACRPSTSMNEELISTLEALWWWMQRKTCPSLRVGFKNIPYLQWNDYLEALHTLSDFYWFVDRSPRDSVPHQWSGYRNAERRLLWV